MIFKTFLSNDNVFRIIKYFKVPKCSTGSTGMSFYICLCEYVYVCNQLKSQLLQSNDFVNDNAWGEVSMHSYLKFS